LFVIAVVALRNLAVTPRQSSYHLGDRIQCSAEGNSAPSYQWTDLVSGNIVQGAVLVISEDMVDGSYVFQCTASNYFNTATHNEATTLNFTVISPGSTDSKQNFIYICKYY